MADEKLRTIPPWAQAALLSSAVVFAGLSFLLLAERYRLQSELTHEKTNLEAFKADLVVLCEVIWLQESHFAEPTSPVALPTSPATLLPPFSQLVAKQFGTSKLEQLCPRSSETVEEPINQQG